MKMYWRSGGTASCPGCFISREKRPQYSLDNGWVGPRASLNVAVKRKIPSLSLPGIEPQSSSLKHSPSTDLPDSGDVWK